MDGIREGGCVFLSILSFGFLGVLVLEGSVEGDVMHMRWFFGVGDMVGGQVGVRLAIFDGLQL